jgi:hypothetical protein
MSTTILPPIYYVVTPRGQPSRRYRTLADTAAALRMLARTPFTISALTGTRTRSLTDWELRELGRCIRALRLRASRRPTRLIP